MECGRQLHATPLIVRHRVFLIVPLSCLKTPPTVPWRHSFAMLDMNTRETS
ncbi:hypothetical protein DPMN_051288 [Dreissena polymorpha]|uniref:Uncharacterized protein n=1 Tax=Dreissena polymorpha TaxID=45954 RepID=A0A9D4CIU7_DREPO|nr:hypothetical protein DPMN_051288 [Dreissena polymorpha]